MGNRALLISTAPVDGYPPVQAQARLLARAGFAVTLVSTGRQKSNRIAFWEPGVEVITVPHHSGRFGRIPRLISFVHAIQIARRSNRPAVEVAYEPLAMFYSDLAPSKPPKRIAHFHESLPLDRWIERRLRQAIDGFQTVVVPDAARAVALQRQLPLRDAPTIVPNYPLLADKPNTKPHGPTIEVIYCGVLGLGQNLPMILKSVPLWPANTRLTLVGDHHTPIGSRLQAQVRRAGLGARVQFTGWIDLAALPARLVQADLGLCLLDDGPEQFRTALGACNKRFQYMQAGLAQIGDRNPGVTELLEGHRIGRCIQTYSAEDLARVVRSYSQDRSALAVEGARAAALHQQQFNYQAAFEPLLARIQGADLRVAA